MKNEAEFMQTFKRSVRVSRGHSISLAAPLVSGIPDLYIIVPSYIPVLLEAKWIKGITREKFKRKIRWSGMQKYIIQSLHEITPFSAMGLIGLHFCNKLYAVLVAYNTPIFEHFTEDFINCCSYTVWDSEKKCFDILSLFAKVPIPKIGREINADTNPRGAELVAVPPYPTTSNTVGGFGGRLC